jgi:hypothetical protein
MRSWTRRVCNTILRSQLLVNVSGGCLYAGESSPVNIVRHTLEADWSMSLWPSRFFSCVLGVSIFLEVQLRHHARCLRSFGLLLHL